MPGVLLERHLSAPTARVTPFSQPDPDWTQLADESVGNADLDLTEALPPPPEVITINEDDVFQVPLVQPPTPLPIMLPKIEQSSDMPVPLPHPQSLCYPTRACRPPQHLHDYVFTLVAEEHVLPPERPYHTAGGSTVDLAIQDEYMMAHICHYVMTYTYNSLYYTKAIKPTKKQYGLKADICAFTNRGSVAVVEQLTQFHTLKCFQPRDPSGLTREDCRNTLTSLMFLTNKRSGKIKARACNNGSTQQSHIAKEEATAPRVTSEAILSRELYSPIKGETSQCMTYPVLSSRRQP